MKTSKDYMEAANATVPKLGAVDAIAKHGRGAHRVPRGMIEFMADPAMEAMYNPIFDKDAEILLVCGAGGQAALAGKTLKEMGFVNVTNIGGFPAWKEAGGPVES